MRGRRGDRKAGGPTHVVARDSTNVWVLRRAGWIVCVGVLVAGAVTLLSFLRPSALTLSGPSADPVRLTTTQRLVRQKDRADQLAAARDAGLKLAAGLGALAAALLAWGRLELSRDEREVARAGQNAGRYSGAIEQLGTDHVDVQVGGLYALEAIIRSSPDYQDAVGQVIAAFVRRRSPGSARSAGLQDRQAMDQPTITALSILVRNDWATPIDLRASAFPDASMPGADLRQALLDGTDLSRAHLDGAKLSRASLQGADLTGASLIDVDLRGAHLAAARLCGASLRGADLRTADLTGANLAGADLTNANLEDADLSRADLSDARLDECVLDGTVLSGANLTNTVLRGVVTDASTMWPESLN